MTNKCLLGESFWNLIKVFIEHYLKVHALIINNTLWKLQKSGSNEIGLKFFWLVLRPFLYKVLTYATLHSFGKEQSLMERLPMFVIGVKSIFEPSLRNLPVRLSIPVVFLILNSLNIFRIDTEQTFPNLSFFSRKLNPLQYFCIEDIQNFFVGSESFLTWLLARFLRCPLKVFAIIQVENVDSFFLLRHKLVVGAFFSGKPFFFIFK